MRRVRRSAALGQAVASCGRVGKAARNGADTRDETKRCCCTDRQAGALEAEEIEALLAQHVSQNFKERNMSDEWQPIESLPEELKASGHLLWLRRGSSGRGGGQTLAGLRTTRKRNSTSSLQSGSYTKSPSARRWRAFWSPYSGAPVIGTGKPAFPLQNRTTPLYRQIREWPAL